MKYRVIGLAAAVALLTAGAPPAGALPAGSVDAYQSYGYNAWGDSISMPDGYLPVRVVYGRDMGTGDLKEPADFFHG